MMERLFFAGAAGRGAAQSSLIFSLCARGTVVAFDAKPKRASPAGTAGIAREVYMPLNDARGRASVRGLRKGEIDDTGQDPREELAFQAQLADYAHALRQEGGGVTKAWRPGAPAAEWVTHQWTAKACSRLLA
jgi:hypothetical protein